MKNIETVGYGAFNPEKISCYGQNEYVGSEEDQDTYGRKMIGAEDEDEKYESCDGCPHNKLSASGMVEKWFGTVAQHKACIEKSTTPEQYRKCVAGETSTKKNTWSGGQSSSADGGVKWYEGGHYFGNGGEHKRRHHAPSAADVRAHQLQVANERHSW